MFWVWRLWQCLSHPEWYPFINTTDECVIRNVAQNRCIELNVCNAANESLNPNAVTELEHTQTEACQTTGRPARGARDLRQRLECGPRSASAAALAEALQLGFAGSVFLRCRSLHRPRAAVNESHGSPLHVGFLHHEFLWKHVKKEKRVLDRVSDRVL